MIRSVQRNVQAIIRQEGNGISVRRVVPQSVLREIDPFMLIEEMGPVNFNAADVRTVPPHPTRAFEQVTWVLAGNVTHTRPDIAAGTIANNIGTNTAEWVTTGVGHLQREQFPVGVDVRTLRIWISLPREERNAETLVINAAPTQDQIQMWTPAPAGICVGDLQIDVLSGFLLRARAPILPRSRTTIARIRVPSNATFVHAVDSTEPGRRAPTVVLYGLGGEAFIGPGPAGGANEQRVAAGHVAILAPPARPSARPNDDEVRIRTRAGQNVDLLWLTGDPVGPRIREPIVQRGTFVMRTEAEVLQAIEDYYTGRFGTLPP